jgi:hypothetical protein
LLRLVRPVEGGGPGIVAVLLIALALVLAGTAGLLRLRRHTVTPPSPSGHSEHAAPAPALVGDRAGSSGASDGVAAGSAGDRAVEGASVVVEPSGSGQRLSAVADLGARGGDSANAGTEGEPAAGSGAPAGGAPATAGSEHGTGADKPGAGNGESPKAASGAQAESSGGKPSGTEVGAGDAASAIGTPAGATGANKAGSSGAGAGAKAGAADASKAGAPGALGAAPAGGSATAPATGNATGAKAGGEPSAAATGDKGGAGKTGAGDRVAEAKVLCDQASSAIDEGDFAHALQLAAASIKLRRTARAFMLRARAEQRLGRVDDALSSLDAATELAPIYGAIWEQRGRILWAARRRDEARAAFSRFLELAPKSTSAPEILRLINEPR